MLADITIGYMGGECGQWLLVRNERGEELLKLLGDEIVPAYRQRRQTLQRGERLSGQYRRRRLAIAKNAEPVATDHGLVPREDEKR